MATNGSPQYNEGDLVQLKSGGPGMTVSGSRVLSTGKVMVDCKWFAGAKSNHDAFAENMLQPYVAPPKK